MGTVNSNFLPASTGLSLGNANQQWSANLQNLTVTGTVALPGIGLYAVPFSATPVFDGSKGNSFTITLTANAVGSTLNLVSSYNYTFVIVQNGVGNWTFTWPANVFGAMVIDPTPSRTNVQQFFCPDGVNLYATSAGVSM